MNVSLNLFVALELARPFLLYLSLKCANLSVFSYFQHVLAWINYETGAAIKDKGWGTKYSFGCQKVFSQVGHWETEAVVLDIYTEYTLKQSRNCTSASLGSPRGCSGPKERNFTYFWIKQNMSFADARENCHSISGKMFDDFDGKKATLNFLLLHMSPLQTFWVGIEHAPNRPHRWITEDKQTMHEYIRISSNSSTADEDKYLAISFEYNVDIETPEDIFYWKSGNEVLPSVCYRIDNGATF